MQDTVMQEWQCAVRGGLVLYTLSGQFVRRSWELYSKCTPKCTPMLSLYTVRIVITKYTCDFEKFQKLFSQLHSKEETESRAVIVIWI